MIYYWTAVYSPSMLGSFGTELTSSTVQAFAILAFFFNSFVSSYCNVVCQTLCFMVTLCVFASITIFKLKAVWGEYVSR
jgi:hypothetical protein